MIEERCWICRRTREEAVKELKKYHPYYNMSDAFDREAMKSLTENIYRNDSPFICVVCRLLIAGMIEGYMSRKDIIALFSLEKGDNEQ